MSDVPVKFSPIGSVLYVGAPAKVAFSREAEHDSSLVFELGENGVIVGLQVLDVDGLPLDMWQKHPDKDVVPQVFFQAVERWLAERTGQPS